ncbi:zinc ribbon domain-containing protein [Paenibacillus spongiae]|uniref:Zinc ribbon domain-containing protein n=1 Tax=Paenibacillus spongiae TaxID=2909671 RepID=A0ABY5S6P3_9BACL|nr:zinc ribbon domain-containing protein [Paenibacillus spongiae]UVI29574.1 zinc ribbon domain-containing protein [Paenibacillus spongiae]
MGIFDKIKQGATKAADMAQQTVEVTRLNSQISTKRKEIDRCLTQMGQFVFDAYRNTDLAAAEPQIDSISQEILHLQREIISLEMKISEIKNEKHCPGCSNTVPYASKFCNGCGHRFEEHEHLQMTEPEAAPETETEQESKVCVVCRAEMESDSRFCMACGSAQGDRTKP